MIQCTLNKNSRKKKYKLKVVIILAILSVLFIFLDNQLRPIVKSVTSDQSRIISTDIINRVIIDELSKTKLEYSDLVNIQRDNTGKVLSVNSDIRRINLLKSAIADKVQRELSSVGTRTIKIPIGTLTSKEVLTGRGPSVNLKIIMSGSIITNLKSSFSSAGINQTRHQIYMNVSTKVLALIPGYPVTTAVETNVIVAETVIVGEVPNVYAATDEKSLSSVSNFSEYANK